MVRRAVKQGVSFCRETSVLIVSKETIRGIIPAASTSREAEYPAQTAPLRSGRAFAHTSHRRHIGYPAACHIGWYMP